MVRLFIDIETLPGDESLRQEISSTIKLPEEPSKREEEIEKKYRETSLEGNYGKILCIGYIKEFLNQEEKGVITGEEKMILEKFWSIAKNTEQFIGHNILDFDLKFIWKRSVIHNIRPTVNLIFARYRADSVYDTMQEWEKWRGYISLNKLAKIFGFESSKNDIDGYKVYDYYKQGKLKEIYDYCMADVELVRKIYKRMNFME